MSVTVFIGFRLMFLPSPFQRQAQVFFPVLLAFFFQAFQIDIDHRRHVLMLLGVVVEAAQAEMGGAPTRPKRAPCIRRVIKRASPPCPSRPA